MKSKVKPLTNWRTCFHQLNPSTPEFESWLSKLFQNALAPTYQKIPSRIVGEVSQPSPAINSSSLPEIYLANLESEISPAGLSQNPLGTLKSQKSGEVFHTTSILNLKNHFKSKILTLKIYMLKSYGWGWKT